jgi:glycosyltransferase involved in cell wall biosynthesis
MPVLQTTVERYGSRRVPFSVSLMPKLMPHLRHLLADTQCVYTQSMELTVPFLAFRGRAREPRVVMAVHHAPGLQSVHRAPGLKTLFPLYEGWVVRNADAIVLVSQDALDFYAARFPAAREKLRLILNGVDVHRFAPQDKAEARATLGVAPGVPLLVFVGRLAPEKDLPLALETLARVRQTRPDAELLIAGDGPDRASLEELVARMRLGGVRFLGRMEPVDLPALYSAGDAVLLTSLLECTPYALLEGLACGVPAVATGVGGCVEVLSQPGLGFLSAGRDPSELAALVERVLAGEYSAAACRARGLAYSAETMAHNLYQLLAA